ncbi:Scr1 family TA system antitoxin-like transcriptional regulator [Streptomyces macrolidinus]|uniref:Scr1 family TA system antitoxin-like transcriptional regulator n=1 Tax=Streptomyces macrolidinus TaxID=2952607 RepID=UPI0035574C1B
MALGGLTRQQLADAVGYIETQEVGVVIEDPAKVSTLGLRYGKLRSQALNVEESARLIERLAGAS